MVKEEGPRKSNKENRLGSIGWVFVYFARSLRKIFNKMRKLKNIIDDSSKKTYFCANQGSVAFDCAIQIHQTRNTKKFRIIMVIFGEKKHDLNFLGPPSLKIELVL